MKAEDGVIMDILLRYVADNREALREIARAPVRAAAAPEPAAATAEPLDVKMDVLQAVSKITCSSRRDRRRGMHPHGWHRLQQPLGPGDSHA